jgi:hypothetical protein
MQSPTSRGVHTAARRVLPPSQHIGEEIFFAGEYSRGFSRIAILKTLRTRHDETPLKRFQLFFQPIAVAARSDGCVVIAIATDLA